MNKIKTFFIVLSSSVGLCLGLGLGLGVCSADPIPTSARAERVIAAQQPRLEPILANKDINWGAAVFVQIFKAERRLDLWVKTANGAYELFKSYPICAFSGTLGPKLAEGDNQSPEGFYDVAANQLNPSSTFHLSFNLGFPNAYDRVHGRTGSFLMVHGNCVSIGCYAMTNAGIEEIYTMIYAALANGQQSIPIHIFPFEMSTPNLERHSRSPWAPFWQNLALAYQGFEDSRIPPKISVSGKEYSVDRTH